MNTQIRYDTIEVFNVNLKAECDQFNLTLETKTKKKRQCQVRLMCKVNSPGVVMFDFAVFS